MSTGNATYSPERGNGNSIKQEMWRMEDRLIAGQAAISESLAAFIREHKADHKQIMEDHSARMRLNDERFKTLDDAGIGAQVEDARREGALGVLTFVLGMVSKNWVIFTGIIAALLALTDRIHISFG